MTPATLTKLWSAIALAALYFGVNGVLDTQGSPFLLPFLLEVGEERSKAAKALFWFLLTAGPYAISLHLARTHAIRKAAATATESWPVMFNLPLLFRDPLARRYQAVWMGLLLTAPLYASGFLLREVFDLQVIQRGYTGPAIDGWCAHLTTFAWSDGYVALSREQRDHVEEELRREGRPPPRGDKLTRLPLDRIAVSYYPGYFSWALVMILGWVVMEWVRLLAVLRRRPGADAAPAATLPVERNA